MSVLRRFSVLRQDQTVDVEVRAGADATVAEVLRAVRLPDEVVDDDGQPVDSTAAAFSLRNGARYAAAGSSSRDTPTTAPERIELHVLTGTQAGARIPLPTEPSQLTLGRSPRADLAIADGTISSRHCTLAVSEEGLLIKDLGSTNGTFVDGVEVSSTYQAPFGAVLRFGDAAVVVRRPSPPDGAVRVDRSGRALFNVTPRQVEVPATTQEALPVAPAEPDRTSLAGNLGMASVTAVGGVGLAVITKRYEMLAFAAMSPLQFLATGMVQRRRQAKRDREARSAHSDAVAGVHSRLGGSLDQERRHLERTLPNAAEVVDIALGPTSRLWERQPDDADFLSVRVGIGARPATAAVLVAEGKREHPPLLDVPVVLPIARDRVIGLHGPRAEGLSRWILMQVAALHSPRRTRIVVLAGADTGASWDWTKWLPHCSEDAGFSIGTDARSIASILEGLARHLDERAVSGSFAAQAPPPSTLVFVPDFASLGDDPSLARVLDEGPATGIAVVCLAATRQELPAACVSTVGVDDLARLDLRNDAATPWTDAIAESISVDRAEQLARAMSRWEPAGAAAGRSAALPYPLSFSDLLGVDLDADAVTRRWRTDASPDDGTSFTMGRTQQGDAVLDLIADGPHFLVAGTAGSGKSELVQTMLASLAVANRPDELNFALFDFKGGACFGAGLELPHTTAVTVNLDGAEGVLRAVRLLRAELHWRETQFNAAGKSQSLDEYRRRRSGDLPQIARLVVVIDEFARFVDALPNVIATIIDIGRIGRSLGVHLLLATQSPRNCVTGDLRSNVQTTIALRTANEAESALVIGADDAASISSDHRGRGLVDTPRAGLTMFQSAWVGAPARGTGSDVTVEVRELSWDSLHAARPPLATAGSTKEFEVLAAHLQHKWRLDPEHRPLRSPLPPDLPMELSAAGLPASSPRRAVIGREDRVSAQDQPDLILDLSAGHHVLVAGSGGTGRTTALRTAALSVASTATPADVHIHLLDLAGTRLASLESLPHLGTALFAGDEYLVAALFEQLVAELGERERAMQTARVDRFDELPSPRPALLLLVDNWSSLGRILERDLDARACWEILLSKGRSTGLTVYMTGDESTAVREVASKFEEKFVLTFVDTNAYVRFDLDERDVPSRMPNGRAIRTSTGNRVQFGVFGRAEEDRHAGAPRDSRAVRLTRLPFPLVHSPTATADLPPLRVEIGRGGSRAEAVVVDLASGPLVVTGTPRSGRSAALALITVSLAERGGRVLLAAGRRSPLASIAAPGVIRLNGPLDDVVDGLGDGPVVLVADDAGPELLEDKKLTMFLADPCRSAVIGLRWDDAKSLRAGTPLVSAVRRSGSCLLLQPAPGASLLSLGIEVPRNHAIGTVPGRGLLIADGYPVGIQVACLSTEGTPL